MAPNEPTFGYYINGTKARHAYRFHTLGQNHVNDLDSKEPSRSQRGYHFENSIKETSLGLEFNFSILTFVRQILTYMSIPGSVILDMMSCT
jgi:hypothetical protein